MKPRSDKKNRPDRLMEPRFQQAFSELLRGSDYSEMTSRNIWDYAVEIAVLKRFGISDNDIRVLVQKRFIEHAQETTQEDSNERTFRPSSCISVTDRTCVVLTPLGIAKALQVELPTAPPQRPADPPEVQLNLSPKLPTWDATQRKLCYDGRLVRQFRRPASNQEAVLSAFEEEGWPFQILDPLAPHQSQASQRRLSETIRSLNRGQAQALIHFHGDGTGEGIQWRPAIADQTLRLPRLTMC